MTAPGAPGPRRYSFERYRPLHETRLDARKADNDAQALLERLGQKVPEGGYPKHPLFEPLQDYCAEVTVNIDWYEGRRKQAEEDWKNLFFGVVAGGVVTSTLAIVLANWLNLEAAITVVIVAFLPAIQGLASAIDYKSRMGGFWKASADLKELLFRLEEAWREKDLEKDKVAYHVDGQDVERTFHEVLKLDRIAARQICRAERESFFNTFRSPAEVVSKFSESLASIRKPAEPDEKKDGAQDAAGKDAPPTPPSPELATSLKASAEGLTQLLQDIEDPKKRAEALATALKLVHGLSKGADKPGSP